MENIIYSFGYEKIEMKDIQRALKFNGIEFNNNDGIFGYIEFLSKLKKMISINILGSSTTIGYVYNESQPYQKMNQIF